MKRAILFVAFAALCGAQTTVNGGRDYKGTLKASGSVSAVEFGNAGGTTPAKAGTSAARPTVCNLGQIYFATDVAAGQNLYFCTVTGAPGVWTQMSGNAATAMTAGTGAPVGNCAPPAVYIDTTNQDLWYCGAANSWKRPTLDTSGFPTLVGTNTWTGYSNFSSGQWRPPESTVANLPTAAGNLGKVFMVTDAATAGSCSTGGGPLRELCRANGSTYECVGGCGSGSGGGGSGTTAYVSSLISGPDSTRTIAGAAHGFTTPALLVAVYDSASPRNAISVGWSVNPTTYDVAIAFGAPQSNYYVVINGGVGPAGPTGAAGPTVYPGAGVPNSTGSAWGTSYTAGMAANNLVQLNSSGQLPALSAALLTNFPALNQNTTGSAAGIAGGSSKQVPFQTGAGATTFSPGLTYNDTTTVLGLIGGYTAGQSGTATGTYNINGATSGTVTITGASAAGSWAMTLPTSGGAAGQFLQTNGSGGTTWANASQLANQGTTTTVLHGNASGNPAFAGIVSADITDGSIAVADVAPILKTQLVTMVITGSGTGGVLAAGDSKPAVWYNSLGQGLTITGVSCKTDSATPSRIQLQRDDGSPANILTNNSGAGLDCSSTRTAGTLDGTEKLIASTNGIDFVMVSAGGAGKWVSVTVTYTLD